MDANFLGLNNFVWWFGVVENRLDPLSLGRCQVRCFGWHTEDINQIPVKDLPWAHPVVPYGVKAVQPPAEGTMVFGFFADGKEGRYPIIMGTVPGIPEEIRQSNMGFTDPFTDAEKASAEFPRRIKKTEVKLDSKGVRIEEDVPRRNPAVLNEPTISRLARPVRAPDRNEGVQPESIEGTTIDYQRKSRVTNIKTADDGSTWDEPYPSFNALYPFNHAQETESGHAIELDDTPEFERVQISHRTGSTLEFLPEGHTKIKSQNGRYDVTLGDQRVYVNGNKYETIDGDYFLRVNGRIRIECDGFDLVSTSSLSAAADGDAQIKSGKQLRMTGPITSISAGTVSLTGSVSASIFGGMKTTVAGGGQTAVGGTLVHMGGNIVEVDAQVFKTHGIQDLNSCLPPIGEIKPITENDLPPMTLETDPPMLKP